MSLSFRQIRAGRFTVGLSGLDETFIAFYEAGYDPDELAALELLARTWATE